MTHARKQLVKSGHLPRPTTAQMVTSTQMVNRPTRIHWQWIATALFIFLVLAAYQKGRVDQLHNQNDLAESRLHEADHSIPRSGLSSFDERGAFSGGAK